MGTLGVNNRGDVMSQGIRTFVRVVLGVGIVWLISGCSSTTSYPTPEEFAKRWNAQPVRRDVDDQAVMQIDQWSECNPGSGSQCLTAKICAGHGRVIATKDANSNDYNYGIVLNQGYAMNPSGFLQCATALQRATNALYDSSAASQEALAPLAKQPETYKVVNGTYSSVTKVQAPNGLVSEFIPTSKGDSTIHEFVQFMDAHDITILVTRKPVAIDGQNEAKAAKKTDDGIDADQLKRRVIAQIAAEHNFSPDDVTQFDANVEKLPDVEGHPAYKVTGNFAVETTRPSNVYEAAGGIVNSNVCAVAPENDPACRRGGFRHTVYFDAKVNLTQKLNGQLALNLEARVGVDKTLEQLDQEAAAVQSAQSQEHKTSTNLHDLPWGQLSNGTSATPARSDESSNEARSGNPDSSFISASNSAGELPNEGSRRTNRPQADPLSGRSTPTSAPAPSFDCMKATTPTELAICRDGTLSELDATVARMYRGLMTEVTPERGSYLKQTQRDWIRERSQCASDSSCLRRSMEQRLQVLEHPAM